MPSEGDPYGPKHVKAAPATDNGEWETRTDWAQSRGLRFELPQSH
jgi:hypothetical protein